MSHLQKDVFHLTMLIPLMLNYWLASTSTNNWCISNLKSRLQQTRRFYCSQSLTNDFSPDFFKPLPLFLKEKLYFPDVRSLLECACTPWDTVTVVPAAKLEKLQNRNARFALDNYNKPFSGTRTKESQGRRQSSFKKKCLRLRLFHNRFLYKADVKRAYYFQPFHCIYRNEGTFLIR